MTNRPPGGWADRLGGIELPAPLRPYAHKAARHALRLARRHPTTAALAGRAVLATAPDATATPVLVHQMGKVASSSVVATLHAAGVAAYHTHVLTEAGIGWADGVYRANWNPADLPWHVWESRRTVARRRRGSLDDPLRIVTLVREPVARNLSSFFQVAELQFRLDVATMDDDEIRRRFLDDFDEHQRPMRWMTDELAGPFGLDPYAEPFDHDAGWTRLGAAGVDAVVIRVEDLDAAFGPAMEALLGRTDLELQRVNEGAANHGDLYDRVRREVALPTEYLDEMYDSQYARHFYTATEIERFRARWSG